jgi:hypothetical protein
METDNNNNIPDETQNEQVKRPQLLTVLCILTFIGSGTSFLSQLFSFVFYDIIPDLYRQTATMFSGNFGESYTKAAYESADLFSSIPRYYFIILACLCVLSIIGAIYMFVKRKIGFHLYIISQILLLGLPLLIMHSGFNFFNFLFSLLFILLYARFLKIMK